MLEYLERLGVRALPKLTSPLDPGYDPATLESHLSQSSHLISCLKLSMACWQIADEAATRSKLAAAHRFNVPVTSGGGPFEVATGNGMMEDFLDLCADLGFTRIEAGEGFIDLNLDPGAVCREAETRGLEVQYEVGKKHDGGFTTDVLTSMIETGKEWIDQGAVAIVVEARESAQDVGLFDENGQLDTEGAERFVKAFGHDIVTFEAPTKASQFALLDRFGPEVQLCNVRLEELLRVEIYRRGLHSDAYANEKLRPVGGKRPTAP